jgi:hypothetical protein
VPQIPNQGPRRPQQSLHRHPPSVVALAAQRPHDARGTPHARASAAAPEVRGLSSSCCCVPVRRWSAPLAAAAPLAGCRRGLSGSHTAAAREKANRVPEGAPGRWWRGCGRTHASTYVVPSSTLASGRRARLGW